LTSAAREINLKNETILLFGCSDWDHWRQPNEFACLFAKKNKVIYVERLWCYEELRWKKISRWDYLRRFWAQPLRKVTENLFILRPPPTLPVNISILSRFFSKEITRFSIRLSRAIQIRLIRRWLQDKRILPTVCFVSEPFDLLLLGTFRERVSCYYVWDEISLFPGNKIKSELVEEIESKFIHRAHLVFASSQSQVEKRRRINPNTFLIANAFDSERFHAVLDSKAPEPSDLQRIPHPRIGYIGSLDFRTDFDLLMRIVDRHPEWPLIIVGWTFQRGEEGLSALCSKTNVHFLGKKPSTEIPNYIKGFDVGLIPLRVTKSTNTMYPLKLHEYLAVGLPVISTALKEVKPFSEVVSIAKDANEFVDLIEEALADNSSEKARARIAVAKENTWEKRVALMSDAINKLLNEGVNDD